MYSLNQPKNSLSILQNGTVKLSLPFCDRYIGKISGDTYFKKVKPEHHKFKKLNSIGFNYELIKSGKFYYVKVEFGKDILQTTRLFILHFGKVQTFYKQSFEKQIFLPIEEFGLTKALEFESSVNSQLSLFKGVC